MNIKNVNSLIVLIEKKLLTFETLFYEKCITYLSKIEKPIYKITDNEYILEAIKLYICEHFEDEKYYYYIGNYNQSIELITNEMIVRRITISDNAKNNLLRQLYALETDDFDNVISDEYPKLEPNPDSNKLLLIISPNKISNTNLLEIKKKVSVITLLGIEIFDMLEHQNFDRFSKYITSEKKDHKNSMSLYYKLFDVQKKMDDDMRERIFIISGYIIQVLGTTYTSDIDVLYYSKGDTTERIKKITKIFSEDEVYDLKIIDKNDIYMKLVRERMVDPNHYFYFMGIKLQSVSFFMKESYLRPYHTTFTDLIMLNKVNNYDINICVPTITNLEDSKRIIVNNKKNIKKMILYIQKNLKSWHDLHLPYKDIKNILKRCTDPKHITLQLVTGHSPITTYIDEHFNYIIGCMMSKYFSESNLLIMGVKTSKDIKYFSTDSKIEMKNKINNITIVESSKRLLNIITKVIDRYKFNSHIDVISGNINEKWSDEYKLIHEKKPYDNIIFNFTIHKVIDSMDNVLQNISNIDSDETTIIITCLDGEKVEKILSGTNKYEISLNDNILFGIYRYDKKDDKDQIVVYLKSAHEYKNGSIERIVHTNDLVKNFKSINYEPVLNTNFLDITNNKCMDKSRKSINILKSKKDQAMADQISELFKIIVFRKNKQNQKGGSIMTFDDIKYKYMNNKINYMKIIK